MTLQCKDECVTNFNRGLITRNEVCGKCREGRVFRMKKQPGQSWKVECLEDLS